MLRVDPDRVTGTDLQAAVEWLRAGNVVAFPTDTLYGLAVDPTSAAAVRSLFHVKGRDASAALPLIAGSLEQVQEFCELGDLSRRLAAAFWPGPLSLVCNAPASIAREVHGGLRTVAIRVPRHPVSRALALAWGAPLTATSANLSGGPPARTAADAATLADARVLVVDGGDAPGGPPSTIVDARGETPALVREGAIAWNRVLHSLQR